MVHLAATMTVKQMAKLGGHARAKQLSPKRLSEIAKVASTAASKVRTEQARLRKAKLVEVNGSLNRVT